MSTRLATRMSLRYLAAALVAGIALSLAPTAPAVADEDPVVRQPRVRVAAPRPAPQRVRTVVQTRTVERVRYVPVYYTTTCGGCAAVAPAPQPVYRPAYYNTTCGNCAPAVAAPDYYAPRYYAAGCGSCGQAVAAPYYWAVRTARYWHAHGYYR
jgi:hypothetical protein